MMESRLIDIPNEQLDEIINDYIDKSSEIVIVVSFVFEKGLSLIFEKLKRFLSNNRLTIITSNYLQSTEPKALRKLLELKSMGAKIYMFDSIKSNQSFHIKSYYFKNSSTNFSKETMRLKAFPTSVSRFLRFFLSSARDLSNEP